MTYHLSRIVLKTLEPSHTGRVEPGDAVRQIESVGDPLGLLFRIAAGD
jgi:hypothetical protein